MGNDREIAGLANGGSVVTVETAGNSVEVDDTAIDVSGGLDSVVGSEDPLLAVGTVGCFAPSPDWPVQPTRDRDSTRIPRQPSRGRADIAEHCSPPPFPSSGPSRQAIAKKAAPPAT